MAMTLCGYVLDDNGNGINGATVGLYINGSGSTTASTTTANDGAAQAGYWEFVGVANNLYYVKVTYSGHVRRLYGASSVQFNNLTIGVNKFSVDSSGNAIVGGTLAVTGASTFTGLATLSGGATSAGDITTTGHKIIADTIGPTSARQHTLPNIASDTLALLAAAQTLTNKTLTAPIISSIVNTGTLTLPTSTDTLVGKATTDTLTNKTLTAPIIATIVNTGTLTLPTSTDTLVGKATTDTLTNKTLTLPVISSISNSGTITLPTGTRTLVAKDTTDTLTNKTFDNTSNVPVVLGESVLAVDTASVTFSSIPSGYRHLKLILYTASTATVHVDDTLYMRFNSDSGASHYQVQHVFGATSAANAENVSTYSWGSGGPAMAISYNTEPLISATGDPNTFTATDVNIPYYANVNNKKCAVFTSFLPGKIAGTDYRGGSTLVGGGWWIDTSAINTISLFDGSTNLKAGSILTLIGVPA